VPTNGGRAWIRQFFVAQAMPIPPIYLAQLLPPFSTSANRPLELDSWRAIKAAADSVSAM
jgi:hypothetical protein